MTERFRVAPYGNAVVNNEPRETWSWAVVPNEENLIGILDCESEEDANLLCRWLNQRAALEEALRDVLRGLPYLGLPSMENWECDHGFPLDECQNDDCGERIAYEAIQRATRLIEVTVTASAGTPTEGGAK